MDPETYEQETIDKQLFGDMHTYFVEDMEATLSAHEGEVVAGRQFVLWSTASLSTHHTCT